MKKTIAYSDESTTESYSNIYDARAEKHEQKMYNLLFNKSKKQSKLPSNRFRRGPGDTPTPQIFTIVSKGSDEVLTLETSNYDAKKIKSPKRAALSAHHSTHHKDDFEDLIDDNESTKRIYPLSFDMRSEKTENSSITSKTELSYYDTDYQLNSDSEDKLPSDSEGDLNSEIAMTAEESRIADIEDAMDQALHRKFKQQYTIQKPSSRFFRGFGHASTPQVFAIVNAGSDKGFPNGDSHYHEKKKAPKASKISSDKETKLSSYRRRALFKSLENNARDNAPTIDENDQIISTLIVHK